MANAASQGKAYLYLYYLGPQAQAFYYMNAQDIFSALYYLLICLQLLA